MPTNPIIQAILNSPAGALNQHLVPEPSVKGKSKYGNKRVEYNGIWFDSKREKNRYEELKVLELVGEITDLQLQVPFQLTACKYIADFVYQRNGSQVVEDVKGYRTTVYKLKKKLMLSELGINITEV